MKLKKFALRGMIILAAVIALCVLFSGTIRSLTTAKVHKADVKNGKLENTIQLSSKVAFPEKEEMKITVPDGLSLTVQRIPVATGQKIAKGDVLLYTQLSDGEKTVADLEKKYDEARNAIEDWDRKHGDIRLTRNEEAWVNAYDAARQADREELNLRQSLMAVLNITDSADLTDENVKKLFKNMSKTVGQPILEDYKTWKAKKEDLAKAKEKLKSLDRYAVSDDVWATLKTKREAEDNLRDAEDKLMQIRKIEKQMAEIKAPHDCYVIEIKVKKGDPLNGEVEVVSITAEGKDPVLRATIDSKSNVQKGTAVTIPSKNYWSRAETKIVTIGVDDEGKQYADAEINRSVTEAMGSVSSMMRKDEIKLKITTRAKESSCMIEAAAVGGEGDNRYVYVVSQEDSPLGGVRLTVRKQEVKVIAESSKWVSVEEDLTYRDIAYLPDRPINDGDTVMWAH